MRVIALIEDAEVLRKILEHLGIWNPRPRPTKAREPPEAREPVDWENSWQEIFQHTAHY